MKIVSNMKLFSSFFTLLLLLAIFYSLPRAAGAISNVGLLPSALLPVLFPSLCCLSNMSTSQLSDSRHSPIPIAYYTSFPTL